MYNRVCVARVLCALSLVSIDMAGSSAFAQVSPPDAANHQAQSAGTPERAHSEHDVQMTREGSGTAWLPDDTPMYAIHWQRGAWQLMAHENAFLQTLHESGARGDGQFGSINWIMGVARRPVGRSLVMFRAMFSAEPWTIGECGYPDLLASGEQCDGDKIHDRQHPHDLVMELAAQYDAPLNGQLRWQAYGGPVGEPALGPVAYPHRLSAMPNPLAPIAHHWLDSTHVTFGVVTGGIYSNKWKAEASLFNGREPDETRTDFDFGPLDSFSGRLWFLPTATVALQVSAGHLNEAEAAEGGGLRQDVKKVTASATYHNIREGSVWASTIAWGRNSELSLGTNALLVESSLTLADQDAWFARFEVGGKTPHDLDVTDLADTLTLTKLQGGYTRYFPLGSRFKGGVGAEGSLGIVPAVLRSAYGRRANVGGGIFLTIRPSMTTTGPGETMIMVQTAFDPANLSCSPPIDPTTAPTTTFEGKTYYFCSANDREEFLKDPRMSLSMMPPR